MTMMQAAVIERYGPPEVIRIESVPVPEPRAGEVLVRVTAAAVTSGDARIRGARFPRGFTLPARLGIGMRGPRRRVPGTVVAGTVERVGEGVTGFSPGDAVAGMTGAVFGAHAERAVVRTRALARVPAGIGLTDAAGALFGGTTALYFLRERTRLRPGCRVLVNGAAGSVGSAAVQLAVEAGAQVTAVAGRANHGLLRRLGAADVVDYRETPVASLPQRFDVVFDAVGTVNREEGLRLAGEDGVVVLAAAGLADTLRARGRVITGTAPERREHIAAVLDLVARGALDPLTEVVGDLHALPGAHHRIDDGHKVGNLVVVPGGAA